MMQPSITATECITRFKLGLVTFCFQESGAWCYHSYMSLTHLIAFFKFVRAQILAYQSEMMLNNVKTFQYNLYLNVQSHVVTLWKKQWEVLASFLSFLQWLLHHKMAKYHLRLSWYIHQSQMICVQLPFKGDVQLKITAVLSYSMKRNIFIRNFG